MQIKQIKVNGLNEPVGIGKLVKAGWIITAEERNIYQKSYRLQIAKDTAFRNLIFDSGEVNSSESANVRLDRENIPLQSTSRYFIRVRVTSQAGQVSEWAVSGFVTALLDNQEWQADFITAESESDSSSSRGTCLRKTISVAKEIESAYAHVTAFGLYQLFCNGEKVGGDAFTPGWTSYRHHLLYQTYDMKPYLKTGENALGGLLGAGWYKGEMGFMRIKNLYGNRSALSCQLHIHYTDGSSEVFTTGADWKGADSPILMSEIYDGETYDARKELDGWNTAQYDDRAWRAVCTVPAERAILTAQPGCRVRVMESLPVQEILTTPQGDTVLDFGQNLTGWVEFRAQGSAGDKIEFTCFETLDADGNVYLDNLRTAKQTITYICKNSEPVCFHPHFSYQGFQYVKITAYPGKLKKESFTAQVLHSDMEKTGSFTCSNPDLNQLQHNITWGMKGNFLDVPTDCPQRDERLGWTGDAQIFCRTACFLMDTSVFFAKWLRDLKEDQTAEGGVPHVVPDILTGKCDGDRFMQDGTFAAAAWADAAVIIPWTVYLTYGDTAVLEDQYDSMKAWIAFMRRHAKDDIWNYKLQFGDWVALDAEEGSYFGATPNDLTCTAYYAYSTGLFAQIAAVLGNKEDAEEYRRLYHQISASYQRHFFRPDGHLKVQTQTAQIVTLYFGLAPKPYKSIVAEDLIHLLEKENGHLVTGFVGTPYFCHALSQNGYLDEAYALLLKEDFPSWLYQVKQGATTVWEHWDGKKPDGTMWSADMNSFNHYAYGAVGDWMYRVCAGIESDVQAPGYKHFSVAPQAGGGLDHVCASFESVHGTIQSEWKREGRLMILKIQVPCNTTAAIRLHQCASILHTDGIGFSDSDGVPCGAAGSGSYEIRYMLDSAAAL